MRNLANPSIEFFNWSGAPSLSSPSDDSWSSSTVTFQYSGGAVQDEPDIYVHYDASGNGNSQYQIRYSTNDGTSWNILVDYTDDNPGEITISSAALTTGLDFSQIKVQVRTTEGNVQDKELYLYSIYTQGSISDNDEYEIQIATDENFTDIYDTVYTSGTSEEVGGFDEGVYWWRVRVSDATGNLSSWSLSREIRIDTTTPTVNITTPGVDEIKDSSSVEVVWETFGVESGTAAFSYSTNGSFWTLIENSTYTYTFTGLTTGDHTLHIQAEDKAGNKGSSSVSIVVDVDEPYLDITSPDEGDIFGTDEVTVFWNTSNVYSGTSAFRSSTNGEDWDDIVGSTYTYTFTGLTTGDHTLYIQAEDKAGNKGSANVSVIVDLDDPSIDITSPEADSYHNTDSVVVTWETSDVHSGTAAFRYSTNGSDWYDITESTFTYTFTDLSEGANELFIQAVDRAANTGYSSVNVLIDTTAPTVPLLDEPADDTYFNTDSVNFSWLGSTPGVSGLDYYQFELADNSGFTAANSVQVSIISYSTSNLTDGEYFWRIRAFDNAGNFSDWSEERKFTVDTQDPVITGIHLRPQEEPAPYDIFGGLDSSDSDTSVEIFYDSISDANPDTTVFSLRLDTAGVVSGVLQTQSDTSGTLTPDPALFILPPLNGAHRVFIQMEHTDRAGNYSVVSSTYYVKPFEPEGPVVIPEPLQNNEGVLSVTPVAHAAEHSEVEFSIRIDSDNFLQSDGGIVSEEVFQILSAWDTVSVAGLEPNRSYSFDTRSRNYSSTQTLSDYSASGSTYTLSLPPSFDTVSSIQSTGTVYSHPEFTFEADGGFGVGKVEYYRVVWSTDSNYPDWDGTEPLWSVDSSTTLAAAFPDPNWHLHLRGYNAAGVPNGTFSYGPMWYSDDFPDIVMDYPLSGPDDWYDHIISSFSGTIDMKGLQLKRYPPPPSPFAYSLNGAEWVRFDNDEPGGREPETWRLPDLTLGEGVHTFQIRAYLNNEDFAESVLYTVRIDTSPPVPDDQFAIEFDDITISSITLVGGTFTDATEGTVEYYFEQYNEDVDPELSLPDRVFEWSTESTRISDGLTPNKIYYYRYRVRDGVGNTTEWSAVYSTATLSIPPSWDTVASVKSTATWTSDSEFEFEAIEGFGEGRVEYYRLAFNTDPEYLMTGDDDIWEVDVSTSVYAEFPSDSWYLHLTGYNILDVPNGSYSFGPFFFSDAVPDIALTWPLADTWYGMNISSFSGVITDNSPGSYGIDANSFEYKIGVGDWIAAIISTSPAGGNQWYWDSSDIEHIEETPEEGIRINFRITDNTGLIGESLEYILKVETTPPAPPLSLSWGDGSSTTPGEGIFYSSSTVITASWAPSYAKSGIKDYRLRVFRFTNGGASSSTVFDGLIGSSSTVKTLSAGLIEPIENDRTYYFLVAAVNNVDIEGAMSPSVEYGVYVDTVPPPSPLSETPDDQVIREEFQPEFSWTQVTDPSTVRYEIELATQSAFDTVTYSSTSIISEEFQFPFDLPRNHYWWRVRAVDGAMNHGPWTSTRTFTSNRIPWLDWASNDPSEEYYEAGMSPLVGTEKSTFTFRVRYIDLDNVVGSTVTLWLRRKPGDSFSPYSMTYATGAVDGGGGEYQSEAFSFTYDEEPYYRFTAFDGLSYAYGSLDHPQKDYDSGISTAAVYRGPVLGLPITFTDHYPTGVSNTVEISLSVRAIAPPGSSIDPDSAEFRVYYGTTPQTGYTSSGISFSEISSNEVIFSVSTDTFRVGDNNYVRWRCEDGDGDPWESQLFRVRVAENKPPVIRIIQPSDGGYTSLNPVIEAEISDINGIDISSIVISVKDSGGNERIRVEGSSEPDIFNADNGILRYRSNDSLRNRGDYTLTITASDIGYGDSYTTSSATSTFTARSQGIADAVSYPNPFDPDIGEATLRYVLSEDARVTINVYDTSRNLIKTVVEKVERKEGQNEDKWDGRSFTGRGLANGIYFVEFIADGSSEHRIYQTIAIFR